MKNVQCKQLFTTDNFTINCCTCPTFSVLKTLNNYEFTIRYFTLLLDLKKRAIKKYFLYLFLLFLSTPKDFS